MQIVIPDEVTTYVRDVFRTCNDYLTTQLSNYPAIREDNLDQQFVTKILETHGPRKLPCDWIVNIEAHYIGGGRHYNRWEVADIGIMMFFRNKGRVVRSKLVMLQSKKLYASSVAHEADDSFLRYGLGRLLESEEEHNSKIKGKKFKFKNTSRYLALKKSDIQQETMEAFQKRFQTTLYYLFYNPSKIPHEIESPLQEIPAVEENVVGCRVVPKEELDLAIKPNSQKYSPSYSDILNFTNENIGAGYRLEHFIADRMLQCKAGMIDDTRNFEEMQRLMRSKTAPMSAVISVTFDSEEINPSE